MKDSTDLKNATNQIGKQYKKLKIQNDSLIADFMAKKQELSEVKEKLSIANKPVVEVDLQKKWSDKKVGISIINNGTGTAFIKTLMYVYNDKNFIGDSKNSYANLLGEMYEESNFPVFEYFGYNSVNDISKANALKSGSEKFIILLKDEHCTEYNIRNFLDRLKNLKINIEYYSADGKLYKYVRL